MSIDPQNPQTPALAELLTKAAGKFEWASAGLRAAASWSYAMVGKEEEAWRWFETLLPMIDQAPGWSSYYTTLVYQAAFCLWVLGRVEHVALVERNLREKTLCPDFRMTNLDSRLSLARLSALRGRHDEAVEWFAKAREVLDEQGARPLRAIVDYDEALMYVRRGRRGDRNRAAPLVEAALRQFREIGMTGWIVLAEELERGIAEKSLGVAVYPDGLTPREVDVLRLIAAGRSNREISEELTLSVRTVARHIANIYTKIGTRNKAEATDYAHRHGLT